MTRKEVLDRFPQLLGILDATNWEELKADNFLLNRLSYSAYKHFVAFQVLLGNVDGIGLCWYELSQI